MNSVFLCVMAVLFWWWSSISYSLTAKTIFAIWALLCFLGAIAIWIQTAIEKNIWKQKNISQKLIEKKKTIRKKRKEAELQQKKEVHALIEKCPVLGGVIMDMWKHGERNILLPVGTGEIVLNMDGNYERMGRKPESVECTIRNVEGFKDCFGKPLADFGEEDIKRIEDITKKNEEK